MPQDNDDLDYGFVDFADFARIVLTTFADDEGLTLDQWLEQEGGN